MKYDVTFTEQAENDLRGIFEYIAFDLLSPENAAGQLDRGLRWNRLRWADPHWNLQNNEGTALRNQTAYRRSHARFS